MARFGTPDTYTAINDITEGGPGFVAVGETWQAHMIPEVLQETFPHSGQVWTSSDGRTWSPIDDASPFEGAVLEHVVVTADGLVAYGIEQTSTGTGYLMRQWSSPDGLRWQSWRESSLGPGYVLTDVIPGGPGFIAVGDSTTGVARIWTSSDGLTWSAVFEHSEPLGAPLFAIAHGPNEYVAIGGGSVPLTVTSGDGAAWNVAPNQLEDTSNAADVAWLDSKFLATGMWDRPGLAVWQSSDGRAWQPITQPPTDPDIDRLGGRGTALSVAGGLAYLSAWIVGAADPAGIWSSADGASWSQIISSDIPADAAMSEVIEMGDGSLLMVGLVGARDALGVIWVFAP